MQATLKKTEETEETPELSSLLDKNKQQTKVPKKGCGHHHHHHGEGADIWTNLSSLGEFACNFVTTAYWSGGLIDLVFGLQSNMLGLSYAGMAAGCVIALLVAIGTMYAHRVLNLHHQSEESHEHSHSHQQTMKKPDSAGVSTRSEEKKISKSLSKTQSLALSGDFLSHALDYAAPITFVMTIALGGGLLFWQKCLIQFLPLLVGAVCGWAGLRTCKQAMIKENEKASAHTA